MDLKGEANKEVLNSYGCTYIHFHLNFTDEYIVCLRHKKLMPNYFRDYLFVPLMRMI